VHNEALMLIVDCIGLFTEKLDAGDRAKVFAEVDARLFKVQPIKYYEDFKAEMQLIFNNLAARERNANFEMEEMETFDE